MNIVGSILAFWEAVKNIRWLWSIISNFGTVLKIWDGLEGVSKDVYKNHKVSIENVQSLMQSMRLALDNGLIDLPENEEIELSKMLKDIEDKLIAPKVASEVKP
jgi:hypothetical protein